MKEYVHFRYPIKDDDARNYNVCQKSLEHPCSGRNFQPRPFFAPKITIVSPLPPLCNVETIAEALSYLERHSFFFQCYLYHLHTTLFYGEGILLFVYCIHHRTYSKTCDRHCTSKEGSHSDENETEVFVCLVMDALPFSNLKLQQLIEAQDQDEVWKQLRQYGREVWPEKHLRPSPIRPYWGKRGQITVIQNVLLMRSRIVILSSMRLKVLDKFTKGIKASQSAESMQNRQSGGQVSASKFRT